MVYKRKKYKRNAKRVFFTTTMLLILFFLGIAGTYKVSGKYFGVLKEDNKKADEAILLYKNSTIYKKAQTEEFYDAMNIIIIEEPDEDLKTSDIIVARLDAKNDKMRLITIPKDAMITISSTLYSSINADAPAIPQMFEAENIFPGLGNGKKVDMIRRIFMDYFNMEIGAVFILPRNYFEKWFETADDGSIIISSGIYEYINSPSTVKNMYKIFSDLYEEYDFEASINFDSFIYFLEYFEKLEVSDFISSIADGSRKNEYFVPDTASIKQKIYINSVN